MLSNREVAITKHSYTVLCGVYYETNRYGRN